jgi:uroporphyrinogen-III synthase
LEQCLGVGPQRRGAATGGVGASEPGGGVGWLSGAQVELARRHGGIGSLFERERLLVRAERLPLAKRHLTRFAEQHPRVGIPREAPDRRLRGSQGAPAIFEGATQVHQRWERLGERRRERAAYPQPESGAVRGVPLACGRAPDGEARQRGADGTEHCLIMGFGTVKLQPAMAPASQPLAGRRIVITRAREQAGELVHALTALGAVVVTAPAIRIEPLADLEPLRVALANLGRYRWIVFTSQNAVQVVFEQLPVWGYASNQVATARVAAIGPATADALSARGVPADLVPDGYVAESLVEAIASQGDLHGARVLIPQAEVARDTLAEGLRKLGADVDVIPVYRTVPAPGDGAALAREILAGRIDAITFTSSSTVHSFVQSVGAAAASCGRYRAAVIGPITAATAREYGLPVAIEAVEHTAAGLVDALARHFGPQAAS